MLPHKADNTAVNRSLKAKKRTDTLSHGVAKNQLDSLEASLKFPVVKLAGMMTTPTTPTDTPSIRNEQIIWSDTITRETASVKIYFYEECLIKDVGKSTQKFPNYRIRRVQNSASSPYSSNGWAKLAHFLMRPQ